MIRRSHEDSDGARSRGWGISGMTALALFGAMLFPLCAHGGSIFDDDYTPPAPVKPAVPPSVAPELKPASEPVKPSSPDTAKPDVPATPPANVPPPAAPDAVPAARKPIPAAADRTKSKAIFDELYVKELADHTPAARRALAAKLIDQAAALSDNLSDRYMLLIGANAAGKDASDLGVCLRAADAMAATFDVDGLRFKSETATKMKLRAEMSAVTADNCQLALKLVDQVVAAGDYLNAQAIIKALRATTSDPALTSQIQSRVKAVETLRAAEERVAPYIQKLKTAPDDATANLEVGKYLCCIKGDWKHGLPLLVKGGKTGASAVAALDLAGASDPLKQADLGDAWWKLAEKEVGSSQFTMRQRAATWYRMSLNSQTVSGLRRVMVEKRVASAQPPLGMMPRATIVSADYGSGGRTTSVAKVFQDILSADQFAPVYVGDWLPDPAPFTHKTLKLSYRVGEATDTIVASEGDVFCLPPIPDAGVAFADASDSFTIVAARYGVDNKWLNVTDAIRKQITDPSVPLKVENMTGGAVLHGGVRNRLLVYFDNRGRRFVRMALDGDSIKLIQN